MLSVETFELSSMSRHSSIFSSLIVHAYVQPHIGKMQLPNEQYCSPLSSHRQTNWKQLQKHSSHVQKSGKGAEREMGGMDEGWSVSEVTGSADGKHTTIQLQQIMRCDFISHKCPLRPRFSQLKQEYPVTEICTEICSVSGSIWVQQNCPFSIFFLCSCNSFQVSDCMHECVICGWMAFQTHDFGITLMFREWKHLEVVLK